MLAGVVLSAGEVEKEGGSGRPTWVAKEVGLARLLMPPARARRARRVVLVVRRMERRGWDEGLRGGIVVGVDILFLGRG